MLRIEAGRLSERLGETEAARAHYDAALLADPRATPALRGLRRIARASGDLVEATRHLDAEIAVAGALERRPLGHYRVDLLMASGDQDFARVAVGELIDSAPSDVRALLAQLELAFLDGRADEFGVALAPLANAVGDVELRAALQSARATLAAHHNDSAGARQWFAAAAESDPSAMGARLGAVRHAAAQAEGPAAARALVDLGRQLETSDPRSAAAIGLRAQQWVATGELGHRGRRARDRRRRPTDPLVARLAARGRGRRRRSGRRRRGVRALGRARRRAPPSARTPPRAPPSSSRPAAPSCGGRRSRSIPTTITAPRSCAPRTSRPTRPIRRSRSTSRSRPMYRAIARACAPRSG